MNEQSAKNKIAWEYRSYEFWNNQARPSDKVREIIENLMSCLRYHKKYFKNIIGLKIANVCGPNGRKAVPLSLLGADVTIFDISEENRRYALELAQCASVLIN